VFRNSEPTIRHETFVWKHSTACRREFQAGLDLDSVRRSGVITTGEPLGRCTDRWLSEQDWVEPGKPCTVLRLNEGMWPYAAAWGVHDQPKLKRTLLFPVSSRSARHHELMGRRYEATWHDTQVWGPKATIKPLLQITPRSPQVKRNILATGYVNPTMIFPV
jgi:hypothetical protein